MNGFTDKPTKTIGEDSFHVKQYISGLSDFILECYTPMTIAIQGDWGSGKTSMMNMIREQLGDRVVTSWFNTWQYSQFNMGDALAVSFFSRLIADLEAGKEQKNEKIKKTITQIARTVSVIAADKFLGGKAAEEVESKFTPADGQNDMDMPQAIEELKAEFQSAVDKATKGAGKDRLVIFIDDLDRLHPGKAVELLEVLKLFLDCDNCVFVLAIDYAVVSQGVKQKYGELIGEEKGRSFFDKIIQVPFKMPVAQYDVRSYVTEALATLGVSVSEAEVDSYVRLIQRSVGCNPRAMKRLFNAFLLLNKIATNGANIDAAQRKMLFAILCMQLSFENIYNYIVQNANECDSSFLQSLAESETYSDNDEAEHLRHQLHLHNETEIMNAIGFMQVFVRALDQDGDGQLAEEEIRAFVKTLLFSTITANAPAAAGSDVNLESHYRYYNRDIIKDVLVALQGSYSSGEYKIYQTRTNNNPNWKRHYAGGWRRIVTSFGNVNFEFKVATNLQSKESSLSIWVYAADKADRRKFVERMQKWHATQAYGFTYLEEHCGFWLNNKNVHADSRDEIIQYFASYVPIIAAEIEQHLLG